MREIALALSVLWLVVAPAAFSQSQPKLLNISSRGSPAYTGNGSPYPPIIGGFITQGQNPITIAIRGLGPSLKQYGVRKTFDNPVVELRDANGTLLQENNDWRSDPSAQQIERLGLAPSYDVEAAMVATVKPGAYTALVHDNTPNYGADPGEAMVELYDLGYSPTRFGNISTRAWIAPPGAGPTPTTTLTLIAGFIIGGQSPKDIVVRGVAAPNSYLNPRIELYSQASGQLVAFNDDWQQDANWAAVQASGLAPQQTLDAAIYITLQPGSYTVLLESSQNRTGLGLAEAYDVTTPPQ